MPRRPLALDPDVVQIAGGAAADLPGEQVGNLRVAGDGHVWGYVICCTCGTRETVNCTPRNADDAAKRIVRFVRNHKH